MIKSFNSYAFSHLKDAIVTVLGVFTESNIQHFHFYVNYLTLFEKFILDQFCNISVHGQGHSYTLYRGVSQGSNLETKAMDKLSGLKVSLKSTTEKNRF